MNIGQFFADAVLNGGLAIAIPLAMVAGLVSFASPCILPLVPGYLAYVSGLSNPGDSRNRRRLVLGVLLFIGGFSAVFVAYGAAFGALGQWLAQWQDLLIRVLGVVVILMGVVLLGRFGPLQRTLRLPIRPPVGLGGAPVLGVVFGLGWTPCIGPTLSAVVALSLSSATAWRGAVLALAYCLGIGIPFLLSTVAVGWVSGALAAIKRRMRLINLVGATTLTLLGVLMVSGIWSLVISQLQSLITPFVTAV